MASAALLFSACDKKSPTRVAEPGSPGSGSIVSIELMAPPEIEPGASVPLTAHAVHADGSRENVSSKAQWLAGDQRVLRITPTGLATGLTRGESYLSVPILVSTLASAPFYHFKTQVFSAANTFDMVRR